MTTKELFNSLTPQQLIDLQWVSSELRNVTIVLGEGWGYEDVLNEYLNSDMCTDCENDLLVDILLVLSY